MKTKYPIILVHGIAVKDTWFLKSFGKIDKRLIEAGNIVYKSKIDSFGTVEDNALALKEEILSLMKEHGYEKVNIIAHSKGGLDAKYMIKHLDMDEKVASLTTLCTPHKGSPVASMLLKLPSFIKWMITFSINTFYRIMGDKNPNSLRVCEQLAKHSNEEEFATDVYCQSYSTIFEKVSDDFSMMIPLYLSHYIERGNESDGFVSRDSAIFGDYQGDAFEESMSHSEIIDLTLKRKKKERVYKFYESICLRLQLLGC